MGEEEAAISSKVRLLRFAVWSQCLGYFLMAASTAYIAGDSRVSGVGAGDFIWPLLLVVAMHALRLDLRLARVLPRGLLAISSLGPSVAAVIGAPAGLLSDFGGISESSPARIVQPSALLAMVVAYHVLVLAATSCLIWRAYSSSRPSQSP